MNSNWNYIILNFKRCQRQIIALWVFVVSFLVAKKKERNKDYTVSQMIHYDELVIEYDNNQKLIEQANNKTKTLDNKSKKLKKY